MANTCFNSIKIEGPEKDLTILRDHINAICKNRHNNIYRDLYLLLLRLGISKKKAQDAEVRDDFTFEGATLENGILSLNTESAWNFQLSGWELVKKALPSIKIWYLSEELCNDIFITNDHDRRLFTTKWFLDSEDVEPEYFDDDDSLIKYVHDNCDSSVNTMEDLRRFLDDAESEGRFFSLHEISYDSNHLLTSN